MKCSLAPIGPGDVDEAILLPDRVVLQRTNELRGQEYFPIFGKFNVLRSYYHCKGESGVFPFDAPWLIVMDGVFGL
jgi:hypothetical protein